MKASKTRSLEGQEVSRTHGLPLLALVSVAVLSGLYNGIWDCDESMNYWEPTHYLLFGTGLQTWEYSPQFALRSYLYIGIHATIGKLANFATSNKIHIFLAIRVALGLIHALISHYLYVSVRRRFGNKISNIMLIFMVFGTGMFISSTSYLPSTFAMYALSLSLGAWMRQQYALAEVMVACAAIIGWPFSALVGVPLAVDILFTKGIFFAAGHGLLSLLYFLVPSILVDTFYYGKVTSSVWNIIDYNVISKNLHGGSELYGVEPTHFYLVNGFLNFNIALPLALLALPVCFTYYFAVGKQSKGLVALSKPTDLMRVTLYLGGFYLWFTYMSSIPHKEERFLFAIYPQLCFGAALALGLGSEFILAISPSSIRGLVAKVLSLATVVICLTFIVLAVSRTGAMLHNYNSTMDVYRHVYNNPTPGNQTICVGREWYRFWTHFFLPENYSLGFLKSGFGGELPQYFQAQYGTDKIPPHFNDRNAEEMSRYIEPSQCNFLVEQELPEDKTRGYPASNGEWEIVYSRNFLHAEKSHPFFRAFYIPSVSESKNVYNRYLLLKRVKSV